MEIEGCFFDTSNYDITNQNLGEGVFGEVYIAKSKINNNFFAAKIIKSHHVSTSRDQMLFLRESLILNKLVHPAIVKFIGINFHSFGDSSKLSPIILTEYYPNGSLKAILDKERKGNADCNWTPTKKYICLLGIADAMKYIHKEGILHRDLKPENILLDANYYPKIGDFGLSRCFSESSQLLFSQNIGTPLYMAPELHENKNKYGTEIDVYAFALIAYEIITGKIPFSHNGELPTPKEFYAKIDSGKRPEITVGVKDNMKELIEKCWSQDPKERPSFDDIFERLSSDFSYSFDPLDENEVLEYLEMLKEERKETKADTIQKLKEDNNNLQNEVDKLKRETQLYKEQLIQKDEEIKKLQNELDLFRKNDAFKLIRLKICEAKKIPNLHPFIKPNPYITVRLKSKPNDKSHRTEVIPSTNNPVWDEGFNLITHDIDDYLIINMYDKGEIIMDQLEFPVSQWRNNGPVDRKEVEIKLNMKNAGTLVFEVKAYDPLNCEAFYSGKEIQLLMIGDCNVGQTSLMFRFVENKFENYPPTAGSTFYKLREIDIKGHKVKLQIWDTSGHESYRNLALRYARGKHGFILSYDVTDRNTLDAVNFWRDKLSHSAEPVVLVGNKIDRVEDRQVSYEEGKKIASENGWSYCETSAKENIGVDDLFQSIAILSIEYLFDRNTPNKIGFSGL